MWFFCCFVEEVKWRDFYKENENIYSLHLQRGDVHTFLLIVHLICYLYQCPCCALSGRVLSVWVYSECFCVLSAHLLLHWSGWQIVSVSVLSVLFVFCVCVFEGMHTLCSVGKQNGSGYILFCVVNYAYILIGFLKDSIFNRISIRFVWICPDFCFVCFWANGWSNEL